MSQYLALFRNRNFLLHWSAGAISNLGNFFNSVALVKVLSTDPQHLGSYMALILAAKMVPGVLLSTVAGVVADRFSRRSIMVISDLVRAILVLGLVFVDDPVAIVALVFLAAVAGAFFNPASDAMLPGLVKPEELVTAGSLAVVTQRTAMLLGNGIGAAVLGAVGAHNVFYIDAASFVASALLVAGLAVSALPAVADASGGVRQGAWQRFSGDLQEVLTFLRKTPVVFSLLSVFALAAVGDAGLNVLLITFFTVGLGIAAEHIGYVLALFGATSVAGALIVGAIGSRLHWRHLIIFGAMHIWATLTVMALVGSPVPSIALLALMGLGSGAINVGANAAIGQLVPDAVRGRVFGAYGTVQSLIFITGLLLAGVLSDAIGPTPALVGYIAFFLFAGVYAWFRLRPPATQAKEMAG